MPLSAASLLGFHAPIHRHVCYWYPHCPSPAWTRYHSIV